MKGTLRTKEIFWSVTGEMCHNLAFFVVVPAIVGIREWEIPELFLAEMLELWLKENKNGFSSRYACHYYTIEVTVSCWLALGFVGILTGMLVLGSTPLRAGRWDWYEQTGQCLWNNWLQSSDQFCKSDKPGYILKISVWVFKSHTFKEDTAVPLRILESSVNLRGDCQGLQSFRYAIGLMFSLEYFRSKYIFKNLNYLYRGQHFHQ